MAGCSSTLPSEFDKPSECDKKGTEKLLEAFGEALLNFTQVGVLLALLVASIIGVIIGIIPTIGGLVAVALALPFIFGMQPEIALPSILAITSVGFMSGSMTAILLNIPGTPPNAATLIDGYPMSQKGEAGRAMGAAITASVLGGMAGVPLALLCIPLIIPLIMMLWSPEMFFLVVMGISFIAVLGRGGIIKGLLAGGLGFLFAFIGYHTITGELRFTLGSFFLFDGLDLISVTLGLFALPEVVELAVSGKTISQAPVLIGARQQLVEGVKDVLRHWGLWLRGTVIGFIIGLIPGIGGETAIFVAYGQAKQISKNPEKFGKGCVEGVIAPESANNAKEAGSLLTTLALGLPGSAMMAILLGAFLLVGITPGPGMLLQHLPLSLTMILSIVVANIIGAIICFIAAPYLVKITTIPSHYLLATVTALIFVGCFARSENLLEIPVVIFFGLLGLLMKRFNYPRPAFLLAFILGSLFEYYFFHSLDLHGPFFFMRPISFIIIFITAAVLSLPYLRPLFGRLRRRRS